MISKRIFYSELNGYARKYNKNMMAGWYYQIDDGEPCGPFESLDECGRASPDFPGRRTTKPAALLTLSQLVAHLEDMERELTDAAAAPGEEIGNEDRNAILDEEIDKAQRRGCITDTVAAQARRYFGLVPAPDWATYQLGWMVHHNRLGDVLIPDQVGTRMAQWDAVDMPVPAVDGRGRCFDIVLCDTDA